MRTLVLIGALAACGRLKFDLLADGATPDAPSDTGTARCDWTAPGGPTFAYQPISVVSLQGAVAEFDPALVPGDPHSMYFTSARDGSLDIFSAHRDLLDTNWTNVVPLADLDTSIDDESALCLDAGALHGYYTHTATGSPSEVYEVSRADLASTFNVGRELVELFDASNNLNDPWPSPDELTLHYTDQDALYSASRASTTDAFTVLGPEPYSVPGSAQQTLTTDQLLVVWDGPGPNGQAIYYATRAAVTDAFGPAQTFPLPATTSYFEPYVRDDGCELHFTEGPTVTSAHIYELQFVP